MLHPRPDLSSRTRSSGPSAPSFSPSLLVRAVLTTRDQRKPRPPVLPTAHHSLSTECLSQDGPVFTHSILSPFFPQKKVNSKRAWTSSLVKVLLPAMKKVWPEGPYHKHLLVERTSYILKTENCQILQIYNIITLKSITPSHNTLTLLNVFYIRSYRYMRVCSRVHLCVLISSTRLYIL